MSINKIWIAAPLILNDSLTWDKISEKSRKNLLLLSSFRDLKFWRAAFPKSLTSPKNFSSQTVLCQKSKYMHKKYESMDAEHICLIASVALKDFISEKHWCFGSDVWRILQKPLRQFSHCYKLAKVTTDPNGTYNDAKCFKQSPTTFFLDRASPPQIWTWTRRRLGKDAAFPQNRRFE